MPLKMDPHDGGTNADGTHSTMYCSYCYENGAFKQPDWTAEQMQAFSAQQLQKMGYPGFLARFFSKGIPKLERWQKNNRSW